MPPVTIYTRQLCGYCARAKQLLSAKGVRFEEKDATVNPAFPQIFIGETHVGGCDDLHALDRAGKLDPLLAA